jgi:hypothetical protein
MDDGLSVIFEEPEFTIATFENALVWSFRGEVNLGRIRRALPVHEALARKYPKGFAVMSIVSEDVPLNMPADARELGARITRDFQPHYCGICEVIEGTGFKGSVARSIVAGIRLVARSSVPAKVFPEVDAASRWIGTMMAPGVGGEKMGARLAVAAQRIRAFSKP